MNSGKLVSGITPRKVIGTSVLAFVLAVGAFGTAKAAEAIFISAGPTTIFDGVVTGTGAHSVTLDTNGNNAVTVGVTSKTVFSGGGSLGDLSTGDPVKIVARNEAGHLFARVITISAPGNYGTAGDAVLVTKGRVTAKASDTFTVNSNGVQVTFHVNSSTRFFPSNTSFIKLKVGQAVQVFGQDTGSSSGGFIAETVFVK